MIETSYKGTTDTTPKFMTIREVARTGILSEYCLRIMVKEGKIPHIMAGTKCLINYTLLLDWLTKESLKAGYNG